MTPPRWAEPPLRPRPFTPTLPPRHVHLIWSLCLGGAERIVADIARSCADCGAEVDVIVLRDSPVEHRLPPGIALHRLGALPWPERHAFAAGVIRASRLPAFCHLMSPDALEGLWRHGCRTVPVVHNSRPGWTGDPARFDASLVPFVVACGEAVARDLAASGLRAPIRVLRHVVRAPPPMHADRRLAVRRAFGAGPATLLIGMVGRFVPQKRATRAVRILAELRSRDVDARLALIAGASDAHGEACRRAVVAQARALGVRAAVVMPGAVADAGSLAPAFDVLLNTSVYEGVSVAAMEAAAAGVPVVSGDVGGQAEAVGPGDALLALEAPDAVWADAILAARPRPPAVGTARAAAAAAHIWPWSLALGPGGSPAEGGVLFVTGNLDVGGAQRSLCHLAAEFAARGIRVMVAVAGPFGVPGFAAAAIAAGADYLDLSEQAGPTRGLHGRASRVLALAAARRPATLAFWNMDAATKLVVVKAMQGGPVRLADVSPGPAMHRELAAQSDLGRWLAFAPKDYLAALDVLIEKHHRGAHSAVVIPNGVPPPGPPLPEGDGPAPPPGANPALAVVTVGRLTAVKRPELLPPVARALARLAPGATLTVVGGVHGERQDEGWQAMLASGPLPDNLAFAGPDHRATGFLRRFAAFYMISADQGCPNASLEAMACGLPVVANPDGGTAEQVVDGITGLLVPEHPERLAEALASLLHDPLRARRMGEAGRDRATRLFSMTAMADAYQRALLPV